MKIGIFGGTFNPIHISHLYVAEKFVEQLGLDRMVLMPALIPPHKSDKHIASAEDRLAMCRLAVKGLPPIFHVSDYEIRNPGATSYTYKTLCYIADKYPDSELFLLMGGDMFLTVTDWRRAEEIYKMATLCVAQRETDEISALDMQKERLEIAGARCIFVDLEVHPLSSTLIRQMVKAGENPADYLPPGVWDYINQKKLYRK